MGIDYSCSADYVQGQTNADFQDKYDFSTQEIGAVASSILNCLRSVNTNSFDQFIAVYMQHQSFNAFILYNVEATSKITTNIYDYPIRNTHLKHQHFSAIFTEESFYFIFQSLLSNNKKQIFFLIFQKFILPINQSHMTQNGFNQARIGLVTILLVYQCIKYFL